VGCSTLIAETLSTDLAHKFKAEGSTAIMATELQVVNCRRFLRAWERFRDAQAPQQDAESLLQVRWAAVCVSRSSKGRAADAGHVSDP